MAMPHTSEPDRFPHITEEALKLCKKILEKRSDAQKAPDAGKRFKPSSKLLPANN